MIIATNITAQPMYSTDAILSPRIMNEKMTENTDSRQRSILEIVGSVYF